MTRTKRWENSQRYNESNWKDIILKKYSSDLGIEENVAKDFVNESIWEWRSANKSVRRNNLTVSVKVHALVEYLKKCKTTLSVPTFRSVQGYMGRNNTWDRQRAESVETDFPTNRIVPTFKNGHDKRNKIKIENKEKWHRANKWRLKYYEHYKEWGYIDL